MQKLSITAPGKVILFGEHAVVYGYPAIATAVHQKIHISMQTITPYRQVFYDLCEHISQFSIETILEKIQHHCLDIRLHIKSNIPQGSGMGSSAACAVALSALVRVKAGLSFSKKAINRMAYAMEKHAHSTPSGVDNTVSCYGGMIKFQKIHEAMKMLKNKVPQISDFWIIHTGSPKETTKELLTLVHEKRNLHKDLFEKYFCRISEIVEYFLHLQQNFSSDELIPLIQENEKILERIGVVSPYTINLISEIDKLGGAAKISGAGGCSLASGIVLVYHPDTEKICQFMKQKMYSFVPLRPTNDGVMVYEK